jgi:membrane protein implicated in regulation of membrane protease activity
MLLYFALGLAGLLLLVITFVLGEIDDLFDFGSGDGDGVGPFNGKVLATGLVAFGATGMLTTYYNWGTLPSALGAAGAALGVGALAWWLLSILYRQQASSDLSVVSLQGSLVQVTTAIGDGEVGQVLYSGSIGSRQMLARTRAGSSLPIGATARIVEVYGSTVVVEPADSPGRAVTREHSDVGPS